MFLNTIPLNSSKSLHRWRVMEAVSPWNIRTRHVCGQDAHGNIGISTSAIQEFDPLTMTIKTRSGKTYILVGPSDNSSLGEATWQKWCNDNGIVAKLDVTSDYLNVNPVLPLNVNPVLPLNVNPVLPLNVNPVLPLNVNPVLPLNVNPVLPLNVNPVLPLNVNPVLPLNVNPPPPTITFKQIGFRQPSPLPA